MANVRQVEQVYGATATSQGGQAWITVASTVRTRLLTHVHLFSSSGSGGQLLASATPALTRPQTLMLWAYVHCVRSLYRPSSIPNQIRGGIESTSAMPQHGQPRRFKDQVGQLMSIGQ